MEVRDKNSGWKFLPNSYEIIGLKNDETSLNSIINNLSNPPNFVGVKSWSSFEVKENSAKLRLNAYNKYLIPPQIILKKDKGRLHAELSFNRYSKVILKLWLSFCAVSYSAFILNIFWEYTIGDGLTTLTLNGEVSAIPVVPWVPLFVFIHSMVFFFYPAIAVSLGWKKSKVLIENLIKISDVFVETP